jgi:hypothetical protein
MPSISVMLPRTMIPMGDPLSKIGLFSPPPWSYTRRGDLLSETGLSSSPPCPLPRGVVFRPKLDFYPHPLGPLPRGEVLCPRSDFPHHPPVLYQEGRSFPRSDFPHHPPVLYQEGRSIVQNRTFLITPMSSTKRGGLLSKIEHFSSPPCPLPRGVVFCPKSDISHHPHVLYQEGRSIVRDRTFLITPLSSTKRGGLLSKIGHFSLFLTRLLLLSRLLLLFL